MISLDPNNGEFGAKGEPVALNRKIFYRTGEGNFTLPKDSRGKVVDDQTNHYILDMEEIHLPVRVLKTSVNLLSENRVVAPYDESVETLHKIKGEARSY